MIRFAPVDFCRIHVHLFFFRELLLLHFQFIQLRAKIIRTVNNVLTCLQYHFPKGKLRRLKIILYHKSLQFLKRSRPQRKTKSIKKKFILMAEPKNRSLKSDWERDFQNLNIWILMSLKSIQYGFHYVILWRRCGKANPFFMDFQIQRFLRGLKVTIIGKRNALMDDAIFEKDRWNSLLVCLNGF